VCVCVCVCVCVDNITVHFRGRGLDSSDSGWGPAEEYTDPSGCIEEARGVLIS
jgi:hypothetical protein